MMCWILRWRIWRATSKRSRHSSDAKSKNCNSFVTLFFNWRRRSLWVLKLSLRLSRRNKSSRRVRNSRYPSLWIKRSHRRRVAAKLSISSSKRIKWLSCTGFPSQRRWRYHRTRPSSASRMLSASSTQISIRCSREQFFHFFVKLIKCTIKILINLDALNLHISLQAQTLTAVAHFFSTKSGFNSFGDAMIECTFLFAFEQVNM